MSASSKPEVQEIEQCTECGSRALQRDPSRGELVCRACGLVLAERLIDPGPDWRGFDHEQRERRAHTGAPSTPALHDKGLTTEIGWGDRDGQGRRIPSERRALMYRLRKWQRRSRMSSSGERHLAYALGEMDRIASRMGLPRSVRESAAVTYRKAAEKHLVRGRSIDEVAAAAIYAACRQAGLPRTLDEIAEASRVRRKVVGRAYRLLARTLGIGLAPTRAADYVGRFASELRVHPETEAGARALLAKAAEKGLDNGKGPTGLAAAALYISSILEGEPRTQQDIAAIAGVTEVTIRNRYKELAAHLAAPDGRPLNEVLHPRVEDLQRGKDRGERKRPPPSPFHAHAVAMVA
jgi:transcription initiation factor TFIIB